MISPSFHETDLGFFYDLPFAKVFFGVERLLESQLHEQFPTVSFLKIEQFHSDIIVPASSEIQRADAHYTTQKCVAPLIQTADCLPVILVSKEFVLSIHAGWRGIEHNIIGKSLEYMADQKFDFSGTYAFIGPHILKESFEVGTDVADQLTRSFKSVSTGTTAPIVYPHSDKSKCFVDLDPIAKAQLSQCIKLENILSLPIDTFSDSRFHSYRRNRTKGRQWSFGFLK